VGTTWQLSCDANFADVDGQTATGCEVDLLTDAGNCGAVGVTTNVPHATASCVNGVVTISSCDSGYYNLDGLAGNGCETQADSWPDSFGTASNIGTLNTGQTVQLIGNIVPQGDVDWFTVTFAPNSAARIVFVSNAGSQFRFENYESATSPPLPTFGGGQDFQAQIGSTAKQLWVKVYRAFGSLNGNSYSLRFSS